MACGCGGSAAADSGGANVLLSGTVSGAAYDASGGAGVADAGIVQGPDGAQFTTPVRVSFFGAAIFFGLAALIVFGALRKRES